MGFLNYDTRTVIANLSNELHHYEEVDSTLRVVDKPNSKGEKVAVISAVPPLSDSDKQTVNQKLDELGIKYGTDQPMVAILGVSDEEKFEDFIQS